MTGPDYDILIIGGGLTGASLAARLGRNDWKTGIIDPRDPAAWPGPPTPGTLSDIAPRVSAIAPDTQDWLDVCGAWQRLPEQRLSPYTGMSVRDATGSGQVEFFAREFGLPALGTIVENAWAEQALWEAIRADRTVDTLTGERAASVTATDSGQHTVSLLSGTTVTTRLLVIADGARSPTREQLGFPVRSWSCNQIAVVTTVQHERPHDRIARQSFHRCGPLAFLPLRDPHRSSIVWSLDTADADAFLAAEPDAQRHRLTIGIQNELGVVTDSTAVHSFPLHQMVAHTYWRPGVVLLGDTAHQVHPLAGQGANLGLRDARELWRVLDRAHRRGVVPDEPLLLRQYTRARQHHNLATIAAMEGFRRLFAADMPALHAARNLGMRLFDRTPALRRAAIRLATGMTDPE